MSIFTPENLRKLSVNWEGAPNRFTSWWDAAFTLGLLFLVPPILLIGLWISFAGF